MVNFRTVHFAVCNHEVEIILVSLASPGESMGCTMGFKASGAQNPYQLWQSMKEYWLLEQLVHHMKTILQNRIISAAVFEDGSLVLSLEVHEYFQLANFAPLVKATDMTIKSELWAVKARKQGIDGIKQYSATIYVKFLVSILAYQHQDVRCGGGSEQQKQQELVLIPPLPRCFGETGFRLSSRSHDECTRNQLVNHLLKDQEEDPKEAKTRVPLKQLRREQKPLVKSDPEAGPENGAVIFVSYEVMV
ncbi:hypothetical protein BTVI_50001 [Pitangus sulphuratus]|nr:hypothetical protein BTVI_50001 [Pitangus sulphuratus]